MTMAKNDDWKINEVVPGDVDHIASIGSVFFLDPEVVRDPNTYIIENKASGEIKSVQATDEDDLGQKISDGEI